MMNMVELDKEYELRMVEAEVDCADGKGSAQACHQLGEYFAVIKHEYERAAQIFELNCETKNHSPSCFSLARFYGEYYHCCACANADGNAWTTELGKGVTSDFDKATKLFGKLLASCPLFALICPQTAPATRNTLRLARQWELFSA